MPRFAEIRAFAIHGLTACGAALALMALIFATGGHWEAMFVCLGLALIVDGIDGPLAREFRVAEVLPRWSGETLDLVVDFVTYVFVPAFAIAASGLLPEELAIASGVIVVLYGALYFKTYTRYDTLITGILMAVVHDRFREPIGTGTKISSDIGDAFIAKRLEQVRDPGQIFQPKRHRGRVEDEAVRGDIAEHQPEQVPGDHGQVRLCRPGPHRSVIDCGHSAQFPLSASVRHQQ